MNLMGQLDKCGIYKKALDLNDNEGLPYNRLRKTQMT